MNPTYTNPTCTICGCSDYESFSFKGARVCEDCIDYLRDMDLLEEDNTSDVLDD